MGSTRTCTQQAGCLVACLVSAMKERLDYLIRPVWDRDMDMVGMDNSSEDGTGCRKSSSVICMLSMQEAENKTALTAKVLLGAVPIPEMLGGDNWFEDRE
ncbi:hypothetical protein FQN55_000943 [Onygenales sp. PD_40]|nr:hypothetical protein FQN55_000943 [Onygenales sp. PD_40]